MMHAQRDIQQEPAAIIRRLWPGERTLWRDHLLRLDPADRRHRFAGTVSDSFIERYCDSADLFRVRLIGAFVDGELRGVGEFALMESPRSAELAFSVESAWQERGIGTELFRRMVTFARNRAVSQVYIVSEPGNARMRHIAAKFGMELAVDPDDLQGRLRIQWPTYLSVLEEVVEEGIAIWRTADAARQVHGPGVDSPGGNNQGGTT